LASINSQLGNVGYVIAIEYGFYICFSRCLLCIVAVLAAEQAARGGIGCHGRKNRRATSSYSALSAKCWPGR
jgi:hypothetical protein